MLWQGLCVIWVRTHRQSRVPFRRCSFSWLSSPWAASWWMDNAAGQKEFTR